MRALGIDSNSFLDLVFFLLLWFQLRVTEILESAVLTLLLLECDEGSNGSDEFRALLLRQLVDLLVEGRDLFKIPCGDQRASLREKCEQLLVVESKSDAGDSDLAVLDHVGQ